MVKIKKPPSLDYLTMNLFGPGMSALHRAGLGGLACTLKAIEMHYKTGQLIAGKIPGIVVKREFPWVITEDAITLKFGEPAQAGDYLHKLFNFGFGIRKDGLIFLPGQFFCEPAAPVLADLHSGLILTFLQHGLVRKLAKEVTTATYDPDGNGNQGVVVEYKKCSAFKHQNGWEAFADKKGFLTQGTIKVVGPISPGTVIRHGAFSEDTRVEETPERMLPLYFAMVGCLALPVNRGVAVVLVPAVQNLLDFICDRPAMNPDAVKECQITNAADAAFRSQLRVRNRPGRNREIKTRARKTLLATAIPGYYAMTFTPTRWANQQKSRVATIHVPPGDNKLLDRYERVAQHLRPRIVTHTIKETIANGKSKKTNERLESFRADSIVRPMIAENLALGRKWYSGFINLTMKINPATNQSYRESLPFERKGLNAMINDDQMWDSAGERIVVQAIHEALHGRYCQIAKENKSNPLAMKHRFSSEYDRWRLDFARSKTPNHFRTALCNLFSRAGRNRVLQKEWTSVLPMLSTNNWQHARDLALLALCSYQGVKDDGTISDNTQKEE